jgi:hypothetical protein
MRSKLLTILCDFSYRIYTIFLLSDSAQSGTPNRVKFLTRPNIAKTL